MDKVFIVGAGAVGTSFAYSLMQKGLANEIVLYDIDRKKALGEVLDLSHGIFFTKPVKIRVGEIEDSEDADIVVITAGAKQRAGETRLQLIDRNLEIFKELVPNIVNSGFKGIFLVVTNPVDILTYVTWKISGFSRNKVIGSGTILDSSRFAYLLSQHCNIDPRSLSAYVIGEHGDTSVAVWSLTHIGGIHISEFCPVCGKKCFSKEVMREILKEVRESAYKIIEYKGATHYAIGLALVSIVEAILRDENRILPVSSVHPEVLGIKDVPLSLLSIVNKEGIRKVLEVNLTEEEKEELLISARSIKRVIETIEPHFSPLPLSHPLSGGK